MTVDKNDLAVAAVKVTPPTFLVWNGLTLNSVVATATLIYVVLQAAHLARKWYLEERARRDKK